MRYLLAVFLSVSAAHAALIVHDVVPGSPAAAAGLRAGDRIVDLDGRKIRYMDELIEIMGTHEPGDTVNLTLKRDGETVETFLRFGESPKGGVSIGVRLRIAIEPGEDPTTHPGAVRCLGWIEETYRPLAVMRELGLDLSEAHETMRKCVGRDSLSVTPENMATYCDNIFKVHCAGLDLLTELGEAMVARCERKLEGSLGRKVSEHKEWKTCGQHKVFDRYVREGRASDASACRRALLEECGASLDR